VFYEVAMSCGVFVVDRAGCIVSANERGRAILRNGLRLINGRLESTEPEGADALTSALKKIFDARKRDRSFLIPRAGSRAPYVVHSYLMSQTLNNTATRAATPTDLAVLIVIDPEHQQPVTADVIGNYLKLPPGEARVAAEISRGHTPRDAAKALSLTEDSVRVILKRVYSKVNVSRQAELVLLVSQFSNCTPEPM
jgi:DNA-binding CsgD family transcriptional regulator